jgi:hypothetical protein
MRKRGNRVEYYVKWKGYPKKFNQLDVGCKMSHFHITLLSNSSASYHSDNKRSLASSLNCPNEIRLEGDYEVGLAEIIYPHTRYSVNNGDEKYWVAVIGSRKK